MTPRNAHILIALAAASLAGPACQDAQQIFPPSLDGPTHVAMLQAGVCLDSSITSDGRLTPTTRACADGELSDIALVASEQNNRVGIIDTSLSRPQLVDLDPSEPGVSHVAVGQGPVAVAGGPDGNAGYALNQIDRSISVINLWWLRSAPDDTISLPGAPLALVTSPAFTTTVDDATISHPDRLIVALSRPNRLWIRDGVQCPQPPAVGSAAFDRLDPDADVRCDGPADPSATLIPLDDRPAAMALSPDSDRLYVAWGSQRFLSVYALDERATDAFGACLSGGAPPCEIDRIGLAPTCANDLDDDGDGLADADDPQCWDALADELPAPSNPACSDGIDNDGDGLVDRDDPQCTRAEDDSEADGSLSAPATCSDGVDNDGDGLVDWPDDPDCYGPNGRSETRGLTLAPTSVSVGPMDRFVYVVDRINSELLVIDAQRGELIDARLAEPGDRRAFQDDRGLSIPPFPQAVAGRVDRRVVWLDPDCTSAAPCDHGVVRYDFGAFVAADDANVYVANAASAFCEVFEDDALLTNREFFARGDAFASANERDCLTVPTFPQPADPSNPACVEAQACEDCWSALPACQACLDDPPAEGCDALCAPVGDDACFDECADFIRQDVECRASGRLADATPLIRSTFNPDFEISDALAREATVGVSGSCETPGALLDAARDAGLEASTECSAPFRPQPLALQTPLLDQVNAISRATLRRDPQLALVPASAIPDERRDADLDPDSIEPYALSTADDYTAITETWTVAWEGVIPGTRRDDALVGDEPGSLDAGTADLCSLGVVVGDRLTIRSAPDPADAAADCDAFDSDAPDYLTWRVAEVFPGSLRLETIDDEASFAQSLPQRACFSGPVDYHVRPHEEWLAYGSSSGYLSPWVAFDGQCVPSELASQPNFTSRLRTGDVYTGPYLSFELREGQVDPIRTANQELRYQFRVDRNFSADRISSNTIFPRQVVWNPLARAGRLLMVPDASGNFVFVRNQDDSSAPNGFQLQ